MNFLHSSFLAAVVVLVIFAVAAAAASGPILFMGVMALEVVPDRLQESFVFRVRIVSGPAITQSIS